MKLCLYAMILFAFAARASAGQVELLSIESPAVHMDYAIDSHHAAQLPMWSPMDRTSPPVDMDFVLNAARSRVQAQLPGQEWSVYVNLARASKPALSKIWYYQVAITHNTKGKHDYQEWIVLVLMDGTVIAPNP